MVPRDGKGVPRGRHSHDQPQDPRRVWPTVDQVAHKDDLTTGLVSCVDRTPLGIALHDVAQRIEQGKQLAQAAMHVTDHVKRSVLIPKVVEETIANHRRRLDLLDASHHVDDPESLAGEASDRASQLLPLTPDHMFAEVAIRTGSVARQGD